MFTLKEEAMNAKRVTCINNEGFPVSLTLGKTYDVCPDEQGTKYGLVRVIDDTGEDYLYPESCFVAGEAVAATANSRSSQSV